MISRVRNLISDKRVSFLLVGGFNTLLGFGIYTFLTVWIFNSLKFGYLISLVISYAVGIVAGFYLYRKFVYKVKGNLFPDFIKFTSVYLFSIALNIILLPLLVQFTPLGPLISQALVIVATTLVSYFGHGYFSFKRN